MVERMVRIHKVRGSIPLISTNLIADRTLVTAIIALFYDFVLESD